MTLYHVCIIRHAWTDFVAFGINSGDIEKTIGTVRILLIRELCTSSCGTVLKLKTTSRTKFGFLTLCQMYSTMLFRLHTLS